jgi:hypothetical protein
MGVRRQVYTLCPRKSTFGNLTKGSSPKTGMIICIKILITELVRKREIGNSINAQQIRKCMY